MTIAYMNDAERARTEQHPLVRAAKRHEERCLYFGQPVADIYASLPPTLVRASVDDARTRRS